ncbi:hypothetical protein AVEN_48455-1 [Araneus ventricosus]|uniref:Uncharacterized protein n=1 Tax=Araneus ventricosus TaxID=182803 RepID=A0A4Y2NW86_ARAVE|nr:hypothetical protein AVEN_48455-1 [Araneus ventricosus]
MSANISSKPAGIKKKEQRRNFTDKRRRKRNAPLSTSAKRLRYGKDLMNVAIVLQTRFNNQRIIRMEIESIWRHRSCGYMERNALSWPSLRRNPRTFILFLLSFSVSSRPAFRPDLTPTLRISVSLAAE